MSKVLGGGKSQRVRICGRNTGSMTISWEDTGKWESDRDPVRLLWVKVSVSVCVGEGRCSVSYLTCCNASSDVYSTPTVLPHSMHITDGWWSNQHQHQNAVCHFREAAWFHDICLSCFCLFTVFNSSLICVSYPAREIGKGEVKPVPPKVKGISKNPLLILNHRNWYFCT